MKFDIVKVIKIVGMVATIGGTIAGTWANGKENERILAKLVEERLEK